MTDINKTIAIAEVLSTAMEAEGHYPGLYGSIRIADRLQQKGIEPRDERIKVGPADTDYRSLVEFIATDDITAWCIRQFINDGKKIAAIKVLRSVSGCGLKEAKEGVEGYVSGRGF